MAMANHQWFVRRQGCDAAHVAGEPYGEDVKIATERTHPSALVLSDENSSDYTL